MEQITIDGRTFTLPYHDLLRPLTEAELVPLEMSIRRDGEITVPVIVDEHDNVIDGGHRLRLAAELGIPLDKIPIIVRSGLTEEEKLTLACDLNVNRRQLSAADLKKAKEERQRRVVELRKQGESLRTIGEKEKVSAEQVRQDLKDATVKGLTVEPEGGAIKGRDGKKRTAKPKKTATPKVEPPPRPIVPPDEPDLFPDHKSPDEAPAEKKSKPKPPPPPYPHSDRLVYWLKEVSSQTHVIRVELGGIGKLLAERDKWDWREVREFILPMLESLEGTIGEFKEEVDQAANPKAQKEKEQRQRLSLWPYDPAELAVAVASLEDKGREFLSMIASNVVGKERAATLLSFMERLRGFSAHEYSQFLNALPMLEEIVARLKELPNPTELLRRDAAMKELYAWVREQTKKPASTGKPKTKPKTKAKGE